MTAVQSDSYTDECSTHAMWETCPDDSTCTITASYSTVHPNSINVLADYFANIRHEQEMYVKAGCAEADLTDCLATWFNS